MADKTGIEWTDATWNPVVGCSNVSPACKNCYAARQAARLARMGGKVAAKYAGITQDSRPGPVWNGTVRLIESALATPIRWKRPRRIFVNSMSDLFHPSLRDEDIDRLFAVMALCPQHTFQVLTKRPERMLAYFTDKPPSRSGMGRWWRVFAKANARYEERDDRVGYGPTPTPTDRRGPKWWPGWPLPNVWLGVTVEDQRRADERIPYLLETPAAARFVSCEPLLGPVDLTATTPPHSYGVEDGRLDALAGAVWEVGFYDPARIACLDWVIAGGESGPKARPSHPDWFRALRDQCAETGTPFMFKQWGEWCPGVRCDRPNTSTYRFPDGTLMGRHGKRVAGRHLDGRLHNEGPTRRFL